MQISFVALTPKIQTGSWVVAASEGRKWSQGAAKADQASGGALSRALKVSRFAGKSGQFLEIAAPAGLSVSRILLVGLGKAEALDGKALNVIGAQIMARLESAGETAATFEIEIPKGTKVKSGEVAAHLAFGARLRSYSFDKYRTRNLDEFKKHLSTLKVATADVAAAKRAYQGLEAVADGVTLTRDLVNEPPNVLYPAEFARRAKALTKLGVKVEVLGEAEMKRQGFGALLGVGQGSARESQLVVMQWLGGEKKSEPVAFVGKGVCFDSGGPAAVTGAMMALAKRKARVNAVGVIGLVENMPGGDAIRPDDVLKSLSGQTIEVLNTDAEGRLVLADALTYTQRRFQPKFVIDLATLTGAIVQTLGFEHAGVFATDDKLAERLASAGLYTGERVW